MKPMRQPFGVFLLAIASTLALAAQNGDAPPPSTKAPARANATQPQEEGERIFQERCANCHNAPEGFSPRISGTIVRHMRVRASLSKQEESALLRFFNP